MHFLLTLRNCVTMHTTKNKVNYKVVVKIISQCMYFGNFSVSFN